MKMDLNSKIFASLDLKTKQAPVKFKPAISQIVKRKEVPSFHNSSAKAADWSSLKFDDTAFNVEQSPFPLVPNQEPTYNLNSDIPLFCDSGLSGINYNTNEQSNQQSNIFEDDDFNDFQEASYISNQQTNNSVFNTFSNNTTSSIKVQSNPQYGNQSFEENSIQAIPASVNNNLQPNNPLYPTQPFDRNKESVQPNYNFVGQNNLFQSNSPQSSIFKNPVQSEFYQSNEENTFQSNNSVFNLNSIQYTDGTSFKPKNVDNFFDNETEFGSFKTNLDLHPKEFPICENPGKVFKENEFGLSIETPNSYKKDGAEFSSFKEAEFQPTTLKQETSIPVLNKDDTSFKPENVDHFFDKETEFGSFKINLDLNRKEFICENPRKVVKENEFGLSIGTLNSYEKDGPEFSSFKKAEFQPTALKQETSIPVINKEISDDMSVQQEKFQLQTNKQETTLHTVKNGDYGNLSTSIQDVSSYRSTTPAFPDDDPDPEFSSFEQAEFQPNMKNHESTSPCEIITDTISMDSTEERDNNSSNLDRESNLNSIKPPDFYEDNISQSSNNSNQFNWNINPNTLEQNTYYSNLKNNLFNTTNQQDGSKKQESPVPNKSNENVQQNAVETKETAKPVIQESSVEPKTGSYVAEYCSAWDRCISACLNIIVATNNVFSSITSASVCNEVVYSCKGQRYLTEIYQIHDVVNRICSNAKTLKVVNEGLFQLEKQFQLTWHNLLSFCPNAPVIEEKSSSELKDTSNCGVCLLPVSDQKIIYCESSYHASCANLWINQVDPVLPNLKLPVT